jgi:hypothetical protein
MSLTRARPPKKSREVLVDAMTVLLPRGCISILSYSIDMRDNLLKLVAALSCIMGTALPNSNPDVLWELHLAIDRYVVLQVSLKGTLLVQSQKYLLQGRREVTGGLG